MELLAALQSFKLILDGVKAAGDIRDEAGRNAAIIDISRHVIDLQGKVVASMQEQAALTEKIRTLEAELAKAKASASDLERYELKDIGGGAMAYMLKPEARGAEPPHWLCPNCYASGKKSIFQHGARMSMGTAYRCSACQGHMVTRATPSWIGGTPAVDSRETCRFCRQGRLDLQTSEPDPVFGDVGLKLDTFRCDFCGKTDERQFDPVKKR